MPEKLTALIGFRINSDNHVTGISLPVEENCPRGLRAIVYRQIWIPGREIIIYLPDKGVLNKISSHDLEEARGFSNNGRRKFLDGVMDEVQYADRIAIQNSRD